MRSSTIAAVAVAAILFSGLPAHARMPKYRAVPLTPEEMKLGEALREAAAKGDVAEMQRLRAEGAVVDFWDSSGQTAMHWAAWGFGDQPAALEWLKAQGLDINAKDAAGRTPLSRAVERGRDAAVQWLKANGAVE